MEDANFDLSKMDPFDFGVIWGTGQGGMQTFENEVENYINGDKIHVSILSLFQNY